VPKTVWQPIAPQNQSRHNPTNTAGAIELHATIRPEAREVINELRKRKMEMVIISGDHEQPTSQLAQELGIDSYFAETLPENTAHKRKEQGTLGKLRRKSVCSVGDGLFGDCAYHALWVQTSQRIRLVAWCVKRRHLALRLS
jgi:Cu2+-exporting ATPase